MTSNRWWRRAGVLVVAVVASLLSGVVLGAAGAQASDTSSIELDVNGSGFTTDPGTPLLALERLAPGVSGSGTVGIRNPDGQPATVHLKWVHVVNRENGCTHSEADVDHTCGDPGVGEGELGAALHWTVESATAAAGPYRPVWSGSTADLVAGRDLDVTVPANDAAYLRVTVLLPFESGNETQTDSIAFDALITLSGVGGGTTGSGTAPGGVTGGGSGVRSGILGEAIGPFDSLFGNGGLARTGVPVLMFAAAGLLLVCCGALIASFARDRRRAG